MRIVAALGSTSLLEPGEQTDAPVQRRHICAAARALAPLATGHELIICYGNGPQVAMLAQETIADDTITEPYPLDVLGAQTQGMIGYWLAQELRNAGIAFPVASILTQTRVDVADPAFEHPMKFIGAAYRRYPARLLADLHHWQIAPDGPRWRRVVPSPEPVEVIELAVIRQLVHAQNVVVCGGGGGAPVVEDDDGQLHGVEAVVDNDLVASLLARELQADAMLLLTDVPAVMRDYGTDHPTPISRIDLPSLRELRFPEGSMALKIEACARFTAATHGRAVIGALQDVALLLEGRAGTTITASSVDPDSSRSAQLLG